MDIYQHFQMLKDDKRQEFLNFLALQSSGSQNKRMQEGRGQTQAAGTTDDVTSTIESQLKKFSTDQRRVLSNLREELQQQNHALVTDISKLLEGFASVVGRVVRRELEEALVGLNVSASAPHSASSKPEERSGVSDGGSTRTWSKVHVDPDIGEVCNGSTSLQSVEDIIKQNQVQAEQSQGKKKRKRQKQKGQSQQQQTPDRSSNSGSQTRIDVDTNGSMKQKASTEEACTATPSMSLYAGIHSDDNVSSSVHFFPEDQPANMVIFEVPTLAETGKVSRSPVYYLQDCPYKVQLSLCFNKKELSMNAKLWGLAPQIPASARVFKISGMIKNKSSQAYSHLFEAKSAPVRLQKMSSETVRLGLSLRTGSGTYSNLTLKDLQLRNYVLLERDSISINWTVTSEEAEG